MVTGMQQQTVGGAGAVPPPHWLPYAPDPRGTYTQLWMSKSAGTSAAEMLAVECESYIPRYFQ